MSSVVWVKVVGFSDVERHSLNTLFRLAGRDGPAYTLWTPESPAPAQVALVDVDSYEAGLELASPNFNPNLKMICVGAGAPTNAWQVVQRPVDWTAMVQMLDTLFGPADGVDFDIEEAELKPRTVPPGVKVSLLVGMTHEDRLYLRARLALAGLTEVDEAQTVMRATAMTVQRNYDLVILGLDLDGENPWPFVQQLKDFSQPRRSVIVATHNPSWAVMEQAEGLGCSGLLEMPFDPQQVYTLLQKV